MRRGSRRWGWLALLSCLAAATVVVVLDAAAMRPGSAPTTPPPARASRTVRAPATTTVPAPSPTPITFPERGGRHYATAAGSDEVVGTGGPLVRFRVELEADIGGVDLAAFAAMVLHTFAAPGGWTANQRWRFRRVGPGQRADFVVYLVTPGTRDALCQDGYDRYTSCRHNNLVVLNIARWRDGVPDYGAPLHTYRQYMINHETGHWLGWGHELCPGRGEPAPVMQQQTLGLHGCVANPWPNPGGDSYHGVSGAYDS